MLNQQKANLERTREKNISCNSECDGLAAITPSGGVGDYTIIWNDPSATEDTVVSNLCSGEFNAQVTDENGCETTIDVTIEKDDVNEIILATSSTVEGDATAVYITDHVKTAKVSRISYGIPIGGELEYVDGTTIARAIEGRVEINVD